MDIASGSVQPAAHTGDVAPGCLRTSIHRIVLAYHYVISQRSVVSRRPFIGVVVILIYGLRFLIIVAVKDSRGQRQMQKVNRIRGVVDAVN